MGADQSLLQFVELGDVVSSDAKFGWSLHEAHEKNGGHVSAFVYGKGMSKSKEKEEFVENVVKNLKLIRHPTIVKFLAAGRRSSSYILVTEQVQPLTSVLKNLSSTEICAGLYNVIEALVFLHDKAGVSHNNLSMKSIYVSEDGVWKLGSMECASPMFQTKVDFIAKCHEYMDQESIPPEDKQPKLSSTQIGHARDAFALGRIASQLMGELVEFGPLVDGFRTKIVDLYLNADPQCRPPVRELLEDRFFKNDYVEIVTFLKMITVKSAEDKERFFSLVVEKLYNLPMELVATRLVPLLLSRFVLLDEAAGRYLLPHLLMPCRGSRPAYRENGANAVLPERAFRQHIIPELYKIFHVRDGAVRLVLLQYFPLYVHMFDRETLQTVILPQLLLGIRDLNDGIVELSLRAVADLVPILGGNILVGGPRVKYFSEGRPKFAKDADEYARNSLPDGAVLRNGSAFREPRHQRRHRRHHKTLGVESTSRKPLPNQTSSSFNGDVPFENEDSRGPRTEVNSPNNDVIIADDDVKAELDNDWLDWNSDLRRVQDNSSVANVLIDSDSDEFTAPGASMAPLPTPVVDWSDAPTPTSSNRNATRKLLSQSSSNTADRPNSSEPLLTDTQSVQSKAANAKQISENGAPTAASPSSRNTHKKLNDLGSEFDIMAIEIKKKENRSEIDELFADMQPNFTKKPLDLLSTLTPKSENRPDFRNLTKEPTKTVNKSGQYTELGVKGSSKQESFDSNVPSHLLAYKGSQGDEADGWGNDFVDFNDWDTDEPESNISLSLPESVHHSLHSTDGQPQARVQAGAARTKLASNEAKNEGDGISLTEDDQVGGSESTESDRLGGLAVQSDCAAAAVPPSPDRRDSGPDRLHSESDSFLPESERNGNHEDVTPTELKSEVDQWLNEAPEDGQ